MDALQQFLDDVSNKRYAEDNLLGLLHVLIGRRVARADGTVVSSGLTWRELSNLLKRSRWNVATASEVGVKSEDLPPRDRQRFWYAVIMRAHVDSAAAATAGDKLAAVLRQHGYAISSMPQPPA